jgi:hypothetical protein
MNGMKGLGDVQDPSLRRTLQQWAHLGRKRWIVSPEWAPPSIQGMEGAGRLLEEHVLQRAWQLLADYTELLKQSTYRVQQPGWLQPPFGSTPEDLVSEDGVALDQTETLVVSYQVPDRHIASFPRFGHMLDRASEWGVVTWTIKVNKKPIRTYHEFKQQRGTIIDPTIMAKPITLKGKDLLEVYGTRGANAATAYVRMPGWVISASSVTQDGTAIDWNVR